MTHLLLATACVLAPTAAAYGLGVRHGRRSVRTSWGRARAGWRAPAAGGYRPAASVPEPRTAPIGRAGASQVPTVPTLMAALVGPARTPTAVMEAIR